MPVNIMLIEAWVNDRYQRLVDTVRHADVNQPRNRSRLSLATRAVCLTTAAATGRQKCDIWRTTG